MCAKQWTRYAIHNYILFHLHSQCRNIGVYCTRKDIQMCIRKNCIKTKTSTTALLTRCCLSDCKCDGHQDKNNQSSIPPQSCVCSRWHLVECWSETSYWNLQLGRITPVQTVVDRLISLSGTFRKQKNDLYYFVKNLSTLSRKEVKTSNQTAGNNNNNNITVYCACIVNIIQRLFWWKNVLYTVQTQDTKIKIKNIALI